MLQVKRCVRFADPSGNIIELVWRPFDSGRRYFRVARCRDHGVLAHRAAHDQSGAETKAFWTQVCNARVSDWIGEAPLLRINPVHHTLALFPSGALRQSSTSTIRSPRSTT